MKKDLVGVVYQTSLTSRFCVYQVVDEETLNLVASHDIEIKSKLSSDVGGLDPVEIVDSVYECMERVAQQIVQLGYTIDSVKTIGLSNERNIVFAWDKKTGQALSDGIGSFDSRTDSAYQTVLSSWSHDPLAYSKETGFLLRPLTSCMSIKWLTESQVLVKQAVDRGTCAFGTLDSWLLWNLLEKESDRHLSDVTNASTTMLMNLTTFEWSEALCKDLNIPRDSLPSIHRDSNSHFGKIGIGSFKGVSVTASIGDLNSYLIANGCSSKGSTLVNYDLTCRVVTITGSRPVYSSSPFLQASVGYKLKNQDPVYILEGVIEFAGDSLHWLKDSLELITDSRETDLVHHQVEDSGDVVFIPPSQRAYSSPNWTPSSRGLIIGLSQFTLRTHVVRAVLDAIAFQVKETLSDMMKQADGHVVITDRLIAVCCGSALCNNESVVQIQSDVLGCPIESSKNHLAGVAMMATSDDPKWKDEGKRQVFEPKVSDEIREARYKKWRKAVERSHDWT